MGLLGEESGLGVLEGSLFLILTVLVWRTGLRSEWKMPPTFRKQYRPGGF